MNIPANVINGLSGNERLTLRNCLPSDAVHQEWSSGVDLVFLLRKYLRWIPRQHKAVIECRDKVESLYEYMAARGRLKEFHWAWDRIEQIAAGRLADGCHNVSTAAA